jgi:hypothetical protein
MSCLLHTALPHGKNSEYLLVMKESRYSTVGIATCYGLDNRGVGVKSFGGGKNFHVTISSRGHAVAKLVEAIMI